MKLLFTFVTALLLCTAQAQDYTPFTGDWKGKIAAFNLTIVFHIAEKDGKLVATMDSPDQKANGIPCEQVTVSNNSIQISISIIGANFNGVLTPDKQKIEGKFNQGGGSFDLALGKGTMAAVKPKPQTPQPPFSYRSEDVEYNDAENTVHFGATITYPSTGKTYPAAILISGSGQQDRDESILGHQPFAVLADYLTKMGFAVLRVDDRGVGKTTGDVNHATSADFAQDVISSLHYLKTRKEIDTNRIGLIGHSEGGLIAAIVAAERRDINFIIMMAGPGVNGAALMAEQCEAVLQKSGTSASTTAAYVPLYSKLIQIAIKSNDSASMYADGMKLYTDWFGRTNETVHTELGFTSERKGGMVVEQLLTTFSSPWMRYFLQSDPAIFLKQVQAKVLALNGEKDIQVLAESNTKAIAAALQNSRAVHEIKILPGLNHLFQKCQLCSVTEYANLEETINESALREIGSWLQQNVLRR